MYITARAPDDLVSAFALTDGTIAMQGAVAIAAKMLSSASFDIFPTFEELAAATESSCPGVIIVNPLHLQVNYPFEKVERLCRTQRVLAFCPTLDNADLILLIELGVRGLIDWSSTPKALHEAVDSVAKGGFYMSQGLPVATAALAGGSTVTPLQADVQGLTSRELEVLTTLARGLTHKEIARQLDLSKATVDTYVQRIRRKLDVGNKAQLTLAAYALGLILREDVPSGLDRGQDSSPDHVDRGLVSGRWS